MSTGPGATLPLRQPEVADPIPTNAVSNNNLGAGTQKNHQQTGGCNNTQVNAKTINNYLGKHGSDALVLVLHGTNNSAARTPEDPASASASAVFHRALPSRSALCRPTTAGRPRGETVYKRHKSCVGRTRRRRVRSVYSPPNKRKADDLKQVAARHRVLLPCAR
jgi:hypothetical protein